MLSNFQTKVWFITIKNSSISSNDNNWSHSDEAFYLSVANDDIYNLNCTLLYIEF